jgi:hypothetical protein
MLRIGILIFTYVAFIAGCKLKNQNEADLQFGVIQGLINGSPLVIYLSEIDMDKTADCGKATYETAATSSTGTGSTTPSTGTSGSQNNTRFAIVSTFNMKSGEILNLRFTYDLNQIQGPINPQQGFSLTGGTFGNSITGRQGSITWGNMGINVIPKLSSQQLNFMQVELNLTGSYVPGNGTTVSPNLCYTIDSVNCTAGQASTQCFTVNNQTCLVDSGSAEAKQVTIRGKITCSAPNII